MAQAGTLRTGIVAGGRPVFWKLFDTWTQAVLPFVGSLLAVRHAIVNGITWLDAGLFLFFFAATGLGIAIGLHRLFTHRSFEPHPAVEWTIGAMAAMSLQNNMAEWVANHRRHHAMSDQAGDVHSPHYNAWGNESGGLRGLWHGYMGWRFDTTATDMAVFGKNLEKDRVVDFYTRTNRFWIVLSMALPPAIGFLAGGPAAAWSAFLFGVCLRVTLTQHGAFTVNSLGHKTGRQDFEMIDRSTNQRWLALLTAGEGWHNNHHRYPRCYRSGLYKGQWDLSAWIIERLAGFGLATNLINNSGIERTMRPGEEPAPRSSRVGQSAVG